MLFMPQPTDSARVAGLLFKPCSKVSACGRRIGGLRRKQRSSPTLHLSHSERWCESLLESFCSTLKT